MKKIVMIPLDERPCNYKYPTILPKEDYQVILPSKDIMCKHKEGANLNLLAEWLIEESVDADAIILSLDTLIFGGLVPSRLHHFSFSDLINRLDIIKKIKENNLKVKLYGLELIMRCPSYSSADEEPYYYDYVGKEIHRLGELYHFESLNRLNEAEKEELEYLKNYIKKDYIDDYLQRRDINLKVLLETLKLVKEEYFDYFIVPQDDASEYGFTAMDQIRVRKYIKENFLHTRISMYPAADDVGISLISRAVSDLNQYRPKVFVKYSSPKAPFCIPWFEDRMQDETIKYHIISAGGIRVYSLEEADIVLCVNMVSKMLHKDDSEYVEVYDIERNLAEFVNYIKYAIGMKKVVAIADTAFCNGSDPELLNLMNKEDLLLKVDTYAGWNTSSNTMGTTLGSAILYFFGRDEVSKLKFLMYRYYEDYGYMVYVRSDVTENSLPGLGLNYFDLKDKRDIVNEIVKDKVNNIMKRDLPSLTKYISSIRVNMPWNRMFETDITIEFESDKLC